MGNLFSNIVGEFRTVHVPVYTTNEEVNTLTHQRYKLLDIVDNCNCTLNEKQTHLVNDIRKEKTFHGGKSRKHRNKRTKRKRNV